VIWWQWLVLGMLLLGAEVAVDAEFYLIFLGLSAMAVGLLGTTSLALPVWGQWLLFSLIAVTNLVVFRSRVYHKIRGQLPDRAEGVDGEIAVVDEDILPGAVGAATLRGTAWQARNIGTETLAAGSRAVVEESEGLVLSLRAER
jgi:membrane protein implicated in regulation of membrane protease activity